MIYKVENPDKYSDNLQDLKVKCPNCGHSFIIPVFIDSKVCKHCNHIVHNNSKLYFDYKLRKAMKEKEQEMTEDEKYYIELEILQEEGMLEEGTNIMELMAQHDVEKQDEEMAEIIEKNKPEKELENHMVLGEYYDE